MGAWYCTRETVKAALDSKHTARDDAQVDRACAAATQAVDGLLHRTFRPWLGTRFVPVPARGRRDRVWLDANEVISVSAVAGAAGTIAADTYQLEPRAYGPPYTSLVTTTGTLDAYPADGGMAASIAVTGLFGFRDDEVSAGELTAAVDSATPTLSVSHGGLIGVGDVLRIGAERVTVTGRVMASTGVTVDGSVAASAASTAITVTDGTGFNVGEVLLIDAERMLVVDVADDTLVVKRAWDGSVLAAHTDSTIYASRRLLVARGALGTTAAAHDDAAVIARHAVPELVEELATAYALNALLQQSSGYGRTVGSGDNEREAAGRGIRMVEQLAYTRYGRKARLRAV